MKGKRRLGGILVGICALTLLLVVWRLQPFSSTPESPPIQVPQSLPQLPRQREGTLDNSTTPARMPLPMNTLTAQEKAKEDTKIPVELPEGWFEKIPPGMVVLIHAETDLAVYDLGAPVCVRCVYGYRGSISVRIPEGHPFGTTIPIGISAKTKIKSGSWCGKAYLNPLKSRVLHPGEQIEVDSIVEVAYPGRYTIEIGDFLLPFEVVDRGDPALIASKAQRIGRRIAVETEHPPDCWTQAHDDQRDMGAKAIPHLRGFLLEAESSRLRAVSAKILTALKARGAVPDLIRGLEDEHRLVRIECLRALEAFGEPSALDAMLRCFTDPDEGVRSRACISMSAFEDERAVSALSKAVRDPAYKVRFWASVELADKGDTGGIKVLIEALRRDPRNVVIPVTRLEKVTGLEFGVSGENLSSMVFSSDSDELKKAAEENEKTAAKWLAWWEEAGRSRFGE